MINLTLKRLGAVITGLCLAVTSFVIISDHSNKANTEKMAAVAIASADEQIVEERLVMTAEHNEETQGKNTYLDMNYVNLETRLLSTSINLPEKKEEEPTLESTIASRGSVDRVVNGEYLDWWKEVRKIVKKDTILTVKDVETQKTFKVSFSYGTNHIDSEPLTAEDSATIKEIWSGYSWERRAVQIYYEGRVIAASMVSYPHAGLDDEHANAYVSNRSGGFGSGTNLDKIKDNDVDGVMCIHFKNSTRHKDNRVDSDHQKEVKKAAGLD